MQINSIQPVAFGYSKKSQKYLEDNIDKKVKDPELQSAIINYSIACNEMEDVVRANEKKFGNRYSDSDFVNLFIEMKDLLITQVVMLFDKDGDRYLESEYGYYASSLPKGKNNREKNWRQSIMDKIRFWNSDIGKSKEELRTELQEARKYKDIGKAQLADVLKAYGESKGTDEKTSLTANTDEKPVLEKLTRTEFSPDGFSQVMGMKKLKAELKEDIIEPVNNPGQAKIDLEEYGKRMPSGVLLYGPPGCGKTYIIEALAAEIKGDVYVMNCSNTGSKYVNQTANNIKKAFDYIYKKGDSSDRPVILFMDEIGAMTSNRDAHQSNEDIKATAALLKYIEGAKAHNVIVIGATNKYDLMDPAIRRRFDIKRYVGLPDMEQREALVRNNLSKKAKAKNLLSNEEELELIASMLQDYSSHSINIISNEASMNAMRRNRAEISVRDFIKAIDSTDEEKIDESLYKPKTTKKLIGFSPCATMVLGPKKERVMPLDSKCE